MEKGFGELFSQSWKEWKESKWLFFKLILIYFGVFIVSFLVIFLVGLSGNQVVINLVSYLFQILIFAVNIFLTLSLIYIGFYKSVKKKMGIGTAIKESKKYFWKFLGLSIVLSLFLLGLFLLFIIPGIIFSIYWIFAVYILIRENTGIMEALRRSKMIVKGRWWKTFARMILFGLIIMGISIVFMIIPLIVIGAAGFSFAMAFVEGGLGIGSLVLMIVGVILMVVFGIAQQWVTLPLGILFFKNFYLDYRTNLLGDSNKPILDKTKELNKN